MYALNPTHSFEITAPVNTYVYEVFILSNSLAVLSSDDTLRLLDPVSLNRESRILKSVGEIVTCCTTLDLNGIVAVAGRDGVVKIWDVRSNGLVGTVSTDDKTSILSLTSCSQYGLAGGSELTNYEASVFLWDLRNLDSIPLQKYNQSHSDDITELKVHPCNSDILLSGSTDGLVNIFNTKITEEEDALHQTINHGASIHHCGFLNDSDFFALSHDEKLSIYKLLVDLDDNREENEIHFGDLRKVLDGEYVVNILGRPDGGAVLGLGANSRETFELVQLKSNPTWIFGNEERVKLLGAHGTDIVRSFCFFDEHRAIFTCGEDGQVKVWKDV